MSRKTLFFAIPALAIATGCDPSPYAKRDYVTITELEASSVYPADGVALHVVMIVEGDPKARCEQNIGGVLVRDARGYICEVKG